MARLLRRIITKIIINSRLEDEETATCLLPSENMKTLRELTEKLPESPLNDIAPPVGKDRRLNFVERRIGPPDRRVSRLISFG